MILKKKTFTKEQVDFIKDGLGIDLIYGKEVELSEEQADQIYDYAVDEEVFAVLDVEDGRTSNLSEKGEIAVSVVDLFSKLRTA